MCVFLRPVDADDSRAERAPVVLVLDLLTFFWVTKHLEIDMLERLHPFYMVS